jgi:hypothetical protein
MTDLLDKLVETLLEITEKKVDAKLFHEDWVKPFVKEVEQLKRRLIQEKCVHEYEWHRVEVGEDMQSVCICKYCGSTL